MKPMNIFDKNRTSYLYATAFLLLYTWQASCVTLFDKSKSYAIYDVWNITTVGKLELTFKTQSQYCLLLYVDDISHDALKFEHGTTTRKKAGSYLEILIVKGTLSITRQVSSLENKKETLGNNLNNLAWHKLKITKLAQTLKIEIDDEYRLIPFSERITNSFRINSRLFIGGLSEKKSRHSYGSAGTTPRFVGCIEELKYSSGSLILSPVYRFIKGESLAPKCMNMCSINPCQNSGRCVNLFTRAGCDCFGTGYDGDRCTNPSAIVHVTAKDYIKLNFHDSYSKTLTSYLRFRFKAAEKNGLIFYTKRTGNYFVVELINGHLRIAFTGGIRSTGSKDIVLNEKLWDGNWHSVNIHKNSKMISVTVDNKQHENLTVNAVYDSSSENEPVYIGGVALPEYTFGVKSKSGFVGCLQQLEYNKNNIIYKVQKTINKRITVIGKVQQGCPFNKTNIHLPTKKPGPTSRQLEKTKDRGSKTNVIKEIHTRESGIGQNVIVWITAAIVVGTILIMISAACVVHHIRIRYHHSNRNKSYSSNKDSEGGVDQTELTNKISDTNTDCSSPELTPTMKSQKREQNRTQTVKSDKHDCGGDKKGAEVKLMSDTANDEDQL